MFSSIFGSSKKRATSDERLDAPPIPAASERDDFVHVESRPSTATTLYPHIPLGYPVAHPSQVTRAAPQIPFHYLQGVPFSLSKELLMSSNKEAFAVQIGDVLAFTARKLSLDQFEYDFSFERSVLRECGGG